MQQISQLWLDFTISIKFHNFAQIPQFRLNSTSFTKFHNFDPNFTFFTKFVVFEKNLSCAFCINIDASSSTTDKKKLEQPYMSWERCTMMIFFETISPPPIISQFCQTLPSLIMFLLILLKCNEVLFGSILPTQFAVVSFNHLKCGSSLAQPYQPTCSSSWIRRHLSLSAEYNGTLSQLLIAHIWQSYLRRSVKSVIVHLSL